MTTLIKVADLFTSQTTDADFRQWGSTMSSNLAAVGLTKGADSGQINWTTVQRPTTTNTAAGFEIWKLNDSLFGAAPIYIKIEYGSANNTTTPGIYASVGTGTNGAGTLTGLVSDRRLLNGTASFVAGSYTSRLCCVDGFFGAQMYIGVNGSLPAFPLIVCRTMDDSGAFTADGCHVIFGVTSGASIIQSLNFLSGTKNAANQVHTLFPTGQTSSLTDDVPPNFQVARTYQLMPKMRPIGGVCVVFGSDIGADTQFQVAVVGTTPRNYISCGPRMGPGQAAAQSSTLFHMAMLWED